jgi:hypothetical protein
MDGGDLGQVCKALTLAYKFSIPVVRVYTVHVPVNIPSKGSEQNMITYLFFLSSLPFFFQYWDWNPGPQAC